MPVEYICDQCGKRAPASAPHPAVPEECRIPRGWFVSGSGKAFCSARCSEDYLDQLAVVRRAFRNSQ